MSTTVGFRLSHATTALFPEAQQILSRVSHLSAEAGPFAPGAAVVRGAAVSVGIPLPLTFLCWLSPPLWRCAPLQWRIYMWIIYIPVLDLGANKCIFLDPSSPSLEKKTQREATVIQMECRHSLCH